MENVVGEVFISTENLLVDKKNCNEEEQIKLMETLFERKLIDVYTRKDFQKHFIGFEWKEIKVVLKKVMATVQFEKAEISLLEFDSIYDDLLQRCKTILSNSNMMLPCDQLKAVLTTSKIIEDKIKFMGKYGLMDKIVANSNIESTDIAAEDLKFMREIYEKSQEIHKSKKD